MIKNKVILWDIDGTLIKLDKTKVNKHSLAVSNMLMESISSIKYSAGKTDVQIIKEILSINRLTLSENKITQILENLDTLTKHELQNKTLQTNPNIRETLNVIQEMGWMNGILTGNTFKRAKMKLESTELIKYFETKFLFHGQYAENRKELVLKSSEYLKSEEISNIVIVGDTPNDIMAAQYFKIPIIAIATGEFSYQQLAKHNPDAIIKNLSEDFDFFVDCISII